MHKNKAFIGNKVKLNIAVYTLMLMAPLSARSNTIFDKLKHIFTFDTYTSMLTSICLHTILLIQIPFYIR